MKNKYQLSVGEREEKKKKKKKKHFQKNVPFFLENKVQNHL